MNRIVLTILLSTIFATFGLYYYNRSESKNNRVFRETLSKDVFFITFIAPLVGAALFSFLISLVFIEADTEQFFKSDVVLLTAMFYLYGVYSVSMGMHALVKAFKSEIFRMKDDKLGKLLYFFHGPFSHTMSEFSMTLILALFMIYNLNHPIRTVLDRGEVITTIACGILLGIGLAIVFAIGNALPVKKWILGFITIFLIYIEYNSKASILHSPLSIYILTCFIVALAILVINEYGPYKNMFMRFVDEKFVSVEKDWTVSNILT